MMTVCIYAMKVWKGLLDESSDGGVPAYSLAVKTSKEATGDGAEEMLREATIMAQLNGHPNCVQIVGVCTAGPPILLLLALCEHGTLLDVLSKRKEEAAAGTNKPFGQEVRNKMCLDTCSGMLHMIKHQFIHRDLAARNVLVDSAYVCKLADFGLARGFICAGGGNRQGGGSAGDGEEDYYRSKSGTFPVRWTASKNATPPASS